MLFHLKKLFPLEDLNFKTELVKFVRLTQMHLERFQLMNAFVFSHRPGIIFMEIRLLADVSV